MTTLVVRMYETQKKARDAAGKLKSAGFPDDTVLLLVTRKSDTGSSEAMQGAIASGFIPPKQASVFIEGVHQGHSLVAVRAAFGYGQRAMSILDRLGPVETGRGGRSQPSVPWVDDAAPWSAALRISTLWRGRPAPFSEMIGHRTLSTKRTFQHSFPELKSSDWTFSQKLGYRLLSESQATTSEGFNLTTISAKPGGESWTRSFGVALLSNSASPLSDALGMQTKIEPLPPDHPAPLSANLGLPTLTGGRRALSRMFEGLKGADRSNWSFSSQLGMRLLSSDPAPASGLLGAATISEETPASKTSSFGFPLLSPDPAPLSSKLGMRVLSKEKIPITHPTPLSAHLGLPTLVSGPASATASPFSDYIEKPVLSNNPTPLSAKLDKPVLSQERTPLSSNWGIPLLARSATPLSSLFRLPVLTG